MVEPNTGTRERVALWDSCAHSLRRTICWEGQRKREALSWHLCLAGKQEPVTASPFVLFLHYMLPPLMPQKSRNISVYLHVCQRKAHPAWQPGVISIGDTNWCFPDRKHSKKGRYVQCRAYQQRLPCFTAPALLPSSERSRINY